MQVEQYKDDAILSVFRSSVTEGKKDSFLNKREWFHRVTSELAKCGYNALPQKRTTYAELLSRNDLPDRKKVFKKEVSINSYFILEVNGLQRTALLRLFNASEQWSHPIVKYLFDHLPRIKGMILKDYTLENISLWNDIKLYCNMVPGMINNYPALRSKAKSAMQSVLALETNDAYAEIYNECLAIVNKIVSHSLLADKVVCTDFDTIVMDGAYPLLELKEQDPLFEQVFALTYRNYKQLNDVCRALSIDIVP